MEWNQMINLGVNVAGGVLTIGVVWLFNRGKRAAAIRGKAKAEAHATWTRHAASGIKGDGFSALFHLHRALHCRMQALAWLIGLCTFWILFYMSPMNHWYINGAYFLALQFCAFRTACRMAEANAMVDVAEEAVKNDAGNTCEGTDQKLD